MRVRADGSLEWTYRVGQCPQCSLLYRIPRLSLEQVAGLYSDGQYADYLEGDYSVNRRRRYQATLAAFSPVFDDASDRTLLDFGCGTGRFMKFAQKRGFDVYGVDIAADAVDLAREDFGRDRVFLQDVPPGSVPGAGFDIITMWSVLAHLPHPHEDLAQLHSLLSPGGRLLIMTVNAESLQRKFFRGRWNGFTPGHLMFWSSGTVERLLRDVGFDRVELAPFYGEGIERGKTRLSDRARHRYIRVVDRHDCGNMLRVVATKALTEPPKTPTPATREPWSS